MEDQVQDDNQAVAGEAVAAQDPSVEHMQAQLKQTQLLMEQQNLAHQNQMKQMMDSLGSLVRGGGQAVASTPEPIQPTLPPGFENLDLEDP